MPAKSASAWPPAEGLDTVNVPRTEAILVISASTRINAPAALVFEALLNVAHYPRWNTFAPKVDGPDVLERGSDFTLHATMDAKKPDKDTPTQLKVTDISTPSERSDYISRDLLESDASYTSDLDSLYRVSWKCEGGFVSRGLKTERFHEVIVLGASECEVRTWENQGGVLAHTVKWFYGKTLQKKFALWCADLKRHSEEKATENGS